MKYITLTQNQVAIVDDEDYEMLMRHKWYAFKGTAKTFYARTNVRCPEAKSRQQNIKMHRVIMNYPESKIDHINGNGLDNRKCNLRLCNQSQNKQNMDKRIDNTSGFKGVTYCKRNKKFIAQIFVNNYNKNLGAYICKEDAARAYDLAAAKYFGEFARLNYPK